MVKFIRFEPAHLRELTLQPAQRDFMRLTGDQAYGEHLASTGYAMTALADDGPVLDDDGANGVRPGGVRRVIGSAGLIPLWRGRANAWVLMGQARPLEWTAIVRRIAGVIASGHRAGLTRIEATCDAEFAQGIRLLQMLGFALEGRLRAYSPDRRDHFQFAHIVAHPSGGSGDDGN